MPTVRFPAVMKYYVNNQTEFSISASTAGELIDKIVEQYPTVRFHLVDSEGNLRKHFNVFVNGTHIRDLNGLDTPLQEEDKVILMASAAGGNLRPVRSFFNLTIHVRTVK
jgi:molybdopterin converting factor small subunit